MSTLRQRQPGPRWSQVVASGERTDSGFESNIDKASELLGKAATSVTAPQQQRGSFDPPRSASAPFPAPAEATRSQMADTHAAAVQHDWPADERAAQKLQQAPAGPSGKKDSSGDVGACNVGATVQQRSGICGGYRRRLMSSPASPPSRQGRHPKSPCIFSPPSLFIALLENLLALLLLCPSSNSFDCCSQGDPPTPARRCGWRRRHPPAARATAAAAGEAERV